MQVEINLVFKPFLVANAPNLRRTLKFVPKIVKVDKEKRKRRKMYVLKKQGRQELSFKKMSGT